MRSAPTAVLALAALAAAQVPQPISRWSAEGNARDSVGSNHGVLKGNAVFASGIRLQAFGFDGMDDYVEVADSPSWAFGTGDFALEAWVMLNDTAQSTGFIAQNDGGGRNNKWMVVRNYSSMADLTFHTNGSSGNVVLSVTWRPAARQWHHVVLSRRGNTWSFYANAVLLDSRSFAGAVPDPGSPLVLGQTGEGMTFLDGRLDEVAVYKRALSQAEVLDLFTSVKPRPGTFATFGRGCASTATLPSVSSNTVPKIGQKFPLQMSGFPPTRGGTLIVGVSNTRWGVIPLPLSLAFIGAGNCDLLVSMDNAFLIVTDAQGGFFTKFDLPFDPSLLGSVAYGQAWVPDRASNQLGISMTNGFKAVVGYEP